LNTALLGCGMVGGSWMAALRKAGAVGRVVGYDRLASHAKRARSLGLVDEVAVDAPSAVDGAELVVLAVPVRASREVLALLAPRAGTARLITDVGSTKSDVLAAAAEALPDLSRFCGAHPMAGTEKSGPDAADANLFAGKLVLLVPGAHTSKETLALLESLWTAVGARTRTMDAVEHDRAMAWVSHLPHAAAFALAAAIGAVADEVAGLCGGGFVDTTRIAASDPTMWRDIFLANREPLLSALGGLSAELSALTDAIEAGDGGAIERLVARAGESRRRVLGKEP
jgi:prephenate dehydrogenase